MHHNASPRALCFALMLALPVYGCPGDTVDPIDGPDPVSPLTAVELCGLYLAADINQNQSGVGPLCFQYFSFSAADITGQQLQYFCRPGTGARDWSDKVLNSLAAERIAIDWTMAASCVEKARALRTTGSEWTLYGARKSEWEALRDGDCKNFYHGLLPNGAECIDDWDCPEGSGCWTDDPWTPGSQKCMKLGQISDACDADWHPCDDAFECGTNATCEAKTANGQVCTDGFECSSGHCDMNTGNCAPAPAWVGLNGTCTEDAECGSDCVSCRPSTIGGTTNTCLLLGGEGGFCRDWNDCAWDLGCTNNICTAVGQGQTCGSIIQTICQPAYACAQSPACPPLVDQTACEAQSPCAWDADYSECTGGTCEVAPKTGPCVNDYLCDQTVAVCVGSTSPTCQTFATDGQPCDDNLATAPSCDLGLTCLGGTCQAVCEITADCAAGQWCDTSGNRPVCTAFNLTACEFSDHCPDTHWCDTCDLRPDASACTADPNCTWQQEGSCSGSATCSSLTDDPTCVANSNCQWTPTCDFSPSCGPLSDQTSCDAVRGCSWNDTLTPAACGPACLRHDNTDQATCEGDAVGCVWDGSLGYCDPNCLGLTAQTSCENGSFACAWSGTCGSRIDCSQFSDETTCTGSPACSWGIIDEWCGDDGNGAVFSCESKRPVGDDCESSGQCETDTCELNEDDVRGVSRCAYEMSGCNTENEALFLRLTFLFGGVWVVARRRRRKV